MAIEKSKRKALVKSVAAFTFAMSMFAANSSSVSAEEIDTANAVGHQISSEHSEEEDDDTESAVADDGNNDDADDITTSEDVNISGTETAENADAAADDGSEENAKDSSLLGDAAGFNVFVKEDYTNKDSSVDVGNGVSKGDVAVGGDVTVGENISAGTVVIGGELEGSYENGYTSGGIDFEEAFEKLEQTSDELAKLEANGTVSVGDWVAQIVFTGNDAVLNIFNLTVEEYNNLRGSNTELSFWFNVVDGSDCLVNITGEGALDMAVTAGTYYGSSKEAVSNTSALNDKILFNVTDASSIVIKSNMGALLATEADVVGKNDVGSHDHFEGSLICNSYVGFNEFGGNALDESDGLAVVLKKEINTEIDDTSEEEDTPNVEDTPKAEEESKEEDTPNVEEESKEDDASEEEDTPNVEEESKEDDASEEEDTPKAEEESKEDGASEEEDTPKAEEESKEDDTSKEEDAPNVEDESKEEETPKTEDTPKVLPQTIPDTTPKSVPTTPSAPVVNDDSVLDLIDPIDEVEPEDTVVPEAVEEIQEEDVTEDSYSNEFETETETFDEAPVPLGNNPFGDEEDGDTATDSSASNPKTGVDMTVPRGAAATAMASFLAMLCANKKKREANQ